MEIKTLFWRTINLFRSQEVRAQSRYTSNWGLLRIYERASRTNEQRKLSILGDSSGLSKKAEENLLSRLNSGRICPIDVYNRLTLQRMGQRTETIIVQRVATGKLSPDEVLRKTKGKITVSVTDITPLLLDTDIEREVWVKVNDLNPGSTNSVDCWLSPTNGSGLIRVRRVEYAPLIREETTQVLAQTVKLARISSTKQSSKAKKTAIDKRNELREKILSHIKRRDFRLPALLLFRGSEGDYHGTQILKFIEDNNIFVDSKEAKFFARIGLSNGGERLHANEIIALSLLKHLVSTPGLVASFIKDLSNDDIYSAARILRCLNLRQVFGDTLSGKVVELFLRRGDRNLIAELSRLGEKEIFYNGKVFI